MSNPIPNETMIEMVDESIKFLTGLANQYQPNDSDLNEGYYDPSVHQYMFARSMQTIGLLQRYKQTLNVPSSQDNQPSHRYSVSEFTPEDFWRMGPSKRRTVAAYVDNEHGAIEIADKFALLLNSITNLEDDGENDTIGTVILGINNTGIWEWDLAICAFIDTLKPDISQTMVDIIMNMTDSKVAVRMNELLKRKLNQ